MVFIFSIISSNSAATDTFARWFTSRDAGYACCGVYSAEGNSCNLRKDFDFVGHFLNDDESVRCSGFDGELSWMFANLITKYGSNWMRAVLLQCSSLVDAIWITTSRKALFLFGINHKANCFFFFCLLNLATLEHSSEIRIIKLLLFNYCLPCGFWSDNKW